MTARALRKSAARRVSRSRPIYRWRKKYAGLMPSEERRLKQLEEENSRLKRMVADLRLDKEMLQDVIRRKL
jgi:putative transposase